MSVYASDDEKVGDIIQVVVDPVTQEISHVVIEQGFIFTTDKVMPVDYIVRQDQGAVYLDRSSNGLDLPDYEETYYVSRYNSDVVVDEEDVAPDATLVPQSVYYYPPIPNSGMGMYYWGLPGRVAGDPVKAVKRVNVPEDSVVIEEGANVYSSDGDHVGDVYSVHMDEESNEITHFIISQGLLFQDYKLVPLFWVSEVSDRGIEMSVDTDQLKQLPKFEPETA